MLFLAVNLTAAVAAVVWKGCVPVPMVAGMMYPLARTACLSIYLSRQAWCTYELGIDRQAVLQQTSR